MEKNAVGSAVLDGVLFEGRGEAFANMLYPETGVQFTRTIGDTFLEDAFTMKKIPMTCKSTLIL
ncbi:hypothetical protein V1498_11720 [Peribacillus sp. SCS-26]|uniref:hypothetical protein n=1 Tax=Paraperibacillus marinus TaxID=3115295 RepID=UPI00390582FE